MSWNYDWRPRNLLSRITDNATGEWHFSHDERERLTAIAFTPRRVWLYEDEHKSRNEAFRAAKSDEIYQAQLRVYGQQHLYDP
ncbi:TPA: hypothetical protein OTT09_004158 [Enterobacter asburiae]|uniref:hypothetical protein n=1 Tax=Enterobacter TaxID=547 RepID=UPI001359D3B1|nr:MULTISPECIES: hypothetical protein [Enterobacter]HCT3172769.1 hypothetical protein [Enterobacter asburiae]